MTSLFSHSLLNDTDRDARGTYRAFSRGKVHAALPGTDNNDRSSADVRPPRKNYAVVAKEIAKTQSLNASLRLELPPSAVPAMVIVSSTA